MEQTTHIVTINGVPHELHKTKHGECITDLQSNISYCERNKEERQIFISLRRLFDRNL